MQAPGFVGQRMCEIKKTGDNCGSSVSILIICIKRAIMSPHIGLLFQNPSPTLPRIQLYHWVTSLDAIYESTFDLFWSDKKTTHEVYSSTPQDLLMHFNVENCWSHPLNARILCFPSSLMTVNEESLGLGLLPGQRSTLKTSLYSIICFYML